MRNDNNPESGRCDGVYEECYIEDTTTLVCVCDEKKGESHYKDAGLSGRRQMTQIKPEGQLSSMLLATEEHPLLCPSRTSVLPFTNPHSHSMSFRDTFIITATCRRWIPAALSSSAERDLITERNSHLAGFWITEFISTLKQLVNGNAFSLLHHPLSKRQCCCRLRKFNFLLISTQESCTLTFRIPLTLLLPVKI